MDLRKKDIRDPKTKRLLGVYYPKDGLFEVIQKGRIFRIKVPPGTLMSFDFSDAKISV